MTYNYLYGKHLKEINIPLEKLFKKGCTDPIGTIYRRAAKEIGLNYDKVPGTFRSSEILVSKDIAERALEIIKLDHDKETAATQWLWFGPKMQEELPPHTIAVSDMYYDKEG